MSYDKTREPQSAQDFLIHAGQTLGDRGKQYDPNGKQERSMTAIVAAFNAIYPQTPLSVHQGWQFLSLVKMVRGATKPHIDSALDQVAYAALAAEEVASELHQPAALCEDEGCPRHGTRHVCITSEVSYTSLQVSNQALAEELGKCQHWAGIQSQELKHLEAKATAAHEAYMQALEHNRSLEVQLDATHSALSDFVCRFDLTKEYMTKEQVLAGQFKHNEQVANLRHTVKAQAERELLDIETINDLRAELAMRTDAVRGLCELQTKLTVALADKNALLKDVEIERNNWYNCLESSESKLQAAVATANYRDKRNAERCAELESLRGSHTALANASQEFKEELDARYKQVQSLQNSLKISEDASIKLRESKRKLEDQIKVLNDRELGSVSCLRKLTYIAANFPSWVHERIQDLVTEGGYGYFYQASEANWRGESPAAHNTDEPKAAPYMMQNSEPVLSAVSSQVMAAE